MSIFREQNHVAGYQSIFPMQKLPRQIHTIYIRTPFFDEFSNLLKKILDFDYVRGLYFDLKNPRASEKKVPDSKIFLET